MRLLVYLACVAACGGSPGPNLTNRKTGGGDMADVSIAFVPSKRGGVLARHQIEAGAALVATVPADDRGDTGEAARTVAYDLDGDTRADLVQFFQVMYGPSDGWIVYTRDGDKLVRAFAISGEWADELELGSTVALRFEANILAPGEPRFSTTLIYDRTAHRWQPAVRSYIAQQTKVPAAMPPFAKFETIGAATLRATTAVDDKPVPDVDESEDGGFSKTAVLRGNVLATYNAGARGHVLASEGEWRYVAVDFATRPTKTSFSHGMDTYDAETDPDAKQLTVNTWLCGWIHAREIKISPSS